MKKLLESKRFMVAIGTIVVLIGVQKWGWQEAAANELMDKIVTVALTLIGAYGIQDTVSAAKGNKE